MTIAGKRLRQPDSPSGKQPIRKPIAQPMTSITVSPTQPAAWRYSTRGIAVRLFLTCWLVYSLHFATNIVREIYPALAIGDHFSFRVDEYANMHPDLFEKPGYGWHINNNPGVSMVAAIPYALSRPLIDPLVERVNQSRMASGETAPPAFDSPWPMAQDFYAIAWQRGYDVKLGLAALVMQTLAMAPSSALGVVVMFYLLRQLFRSDRVAFWLSILYAFGTPVFFRTGYLNHNMMMGHIAFLGFVMMWNLGASARWSSQLRYFWGGVTGGAAVLFDYSGAVLLLGLFLYGIAKRWLAAPLQGAASKEPSFKDIVRHAFWYGVGAIGPIALLWFYQWQSFGNPFLPAQHWMPQVAWSDQGYQGLSLPRVDLLLMLLFDYRFGLFVVSPLLFLPLLTPFFDKGERKQLPTLEFTFILALAVAMWLFCAGTNYTWLQFNTGIRYLAPLFPFLFVPAAVTLMRLPKPLVFAIVVLSFVISWPLAMYRDVESGFGILNPILRTFINGFQLPVMMTLSQMDLKSYALPIGANTSPLPILLLLAVILYGIWSPQWSSGVRQST